MDENRCICCGQIIPEGRQVCPACEAKNKVQAGLSDSFLEMAYRVVVFAGAKTEEEKQLLEIIVKCCNNNGISFRKYMMTVSEVNQELLKLQQEAENGEQQ